MQEEGLKIKQRQSPSPKFKSCKKIRESCQEIQHYSKRNFRKWGHIRYKNGVMKNYLELKETFQDMKLKIEIPLGIEYNK